MDPEPAIPGAAERRLAAGDADFLIREEPLLIRIGDQQVLTMRTPGDDLNLALGFLLSEGVIRDVATITGHTFRAGDPAELRADSLTLEARATGNVEVRGRLTRTHEIRSSCGICGLTDPDELLESTPPLLPGVPRLTHERIDALRADFGSRTPLFDRTGASHGAAIYDEHGTVLGSGEDVGRHNALDKAIGAASSAGQDLRHGIAMLSGRAGYDLVIKCLRVGIPVILSVSAASALSHDLCVAAHATLVGFVRTGRMKIYCDGGRIAE